MLLKEDTIMDASTGSAKKKKGFGIFYTPEIVVDFIFRLLLVHKNRQNGRWNGSNGKQKFPSVIDPAAGEGVFLKKAVQNGFTDAKHIFGLDLDGAAVEKWKTIHLLNDVFQGDEQELKRHFFHQNGLVPVKWGQHTEHYKGLKKADIENKQFDAVVGNPPYGGIGVDFTKDFNSSESMELLHALQNFEIIRYKKFGAPSQQKKSDVLEFDFAAEPLENYNVQLPLSEIAKQAQSMPVEVLFVERFIQLAKPGGWIAMIIPDGILSNSQLNYVRGFISAKCYVRAIVSLPSETFKNAGTNAKTSVLLLEKKKNIHDMNEDYRVFLASMTDSKGKKGLIKQPFDFISDNYYSYVNFDTLLSTELDWRHNPSYNKLNITVHR